MQYLVVDKDPFGNDLMLIDLSYCACLLYKIYDELIKYCALLGFGGFLNAENSRLITISLHYTPMIKNRKNRLFAY